jgi:hypothetical protein
VKSSPFQFLNPFSGVPWSSLWFTLWSYPSTRCKTWLSVLYSICLPWCLLACISFLWFSWVRSTIRNCLSLLSGCSNNVWCLLGNTNLILSHHWRCLKVFMSLGSKYFLNKHLNFHFNTISFYQKKIEAHWHPLLQFNIIVLKSGSSNVMQ